MADTKISALPNLGTAAGTEQLPVNDAGTNKRVTVAVVKRFCQFWGVQAYTEADDPVDLPATNSAQIITNTGAGAAIAFNLPAAGSAVLGTVLEFSVVAAHNMVVTADVGVTIRVGANASTAGGTFTCGTPGGHLVLKYVSADLWQGTSSGTWVAA